MNNMNPNDLVNLKTRTLALQKEQLRRIAENDPNAQVYEYEEGEAPTDLMPAQRVAELLRIAREESIRIRNDRSLQKWDDFHTQLELQARLEGDKADEEEKKLKIMSMYESLKRYVLYFHPDWKNEEEKIHAEIGLLSARAVDAYLQTMNEIVAEQIRDGSGNNGGEGDQGQQPVNSIQGKDIEAEVFERLDGSKASAEQKKLTLGSMFRNFKKYLISIRPHLANNEQQLLQDMRFISGYIALTYKQTRDSIPAQPFDDDHIRYQVQKNKPEVNELFKHYGKMFEKVTSSTTSEKQMEVIYNMIQLRAEVEQGLIPDNIADVHASEYLQNTFLTGQQKAQMAVNAAKAGHATGMNRAERRRLLREHK